MARLNHHRLRHRGRPTETAFAPRRKQWHPNQAARCGEVRTLSPQEIATYAAARGFKVAAR